MSARSFAHSPCLYPSEMLIQSIQLQTENSTPFDLNSSKEELKEDGTGREGIPVMS